MTINYNQENLQVITQIIKNNLYPDLLPKKWIERNRTNPTFGHCHNVAGCLYKVFGKDAVKMYRALDDEGIYHWWVKDLNGNIIDLTADQYYSTNRTPPYDKGEKAGLLGFEYKKRVLKLYERVMNEYNSKPNVLNFYNEDVK